MNKFAIGLTIFGAAVANFGSVAIAADSVTDFYKGKTLYLQIGTPPGGGYDILGRAVGRHIGKHIPGNPNIVVQNIPGGGGIQIANQFGTTTARDGTVIGLLNNGSPSTPLIDPTSAHFDARKFYFLGSPTREIQILVVWHTAKVKTLADVFTTELIVGALGPGTATREFPLVTNAIIGTKYKLVQGYSGGAETKLAMERGEIEANAGLAWGAAKSAYADLLERKQLLIVGQYAFKPHRELKDIPLFPTGKTEEDRQIFQLMYSRQDYGRPFLLPPDVPADRAAALRAAFAKTMNDPEFAAEMKKLNLDLEFVPPEELQTLTDELYKTSPEVVTRLKTILGGQ